MITSDSLAKVKQLATQLYFQGIRDALSGQSPILGRTQSDNALHGMQGMTLEKERELLDLIEKDYYSLPDSVQWRINKFGSEMEMSMIEHLLSEGMVIPDEH